MADLYQQARDALDAGRRDEAMAFIDEALAASPEDEAVRELYAGLHLARGVRLAAQARERRRVDLQRRRLKPGEEFRDGDEVVAAFDEAIVELRRVLEVEPGSEKAKMMLATALFRRDREAHRAESVRLLEEIARENPENRQATYAIRRVAKPCASCSDTGLCPHCLGRGVRRRLGFDLRCDRCNGQGICPRCGVL